MVYHRHRHLGTDSHIHKLIGCHGYRFLPRHDLIVSRVPQQWMFHSGMGLKQNGCFGEIAHINLKSMPVVFNNNRHLGLFISRRTSVAYMLLHHLMLLVIILKIPILLLKLTGLLRLINASIKPQSSE